jgi:hypothetical protein
VLLVVQSGSSVAVYCEFSDLEVSLNVLDVSQLVVDLLRAAMHRTSTAVCRLDATRCCADDATYNAAYVTHV